MAKLDCPDSGSRVFEKIQKNRRFTSNSAELP